MYYILYSLYQLLYFTFPIVGRIKNFLKYLKDKAAQKNSNAKKKKNNGQRLKLMFSISYKFLISEYSEDEIILITWKLIKEESSYLQLDRHKTHAYTSI